MKSSILPGLFQEKSTLTLFYCNFTEIRDLCAIDNEVSIGNSFHSCACDFASNEICEILDEVERERNIDGRFDYVDLTGM